MRSFLSVALLFSLVTASPHKSHKKVSVSSQAQAADHSKPPAGAIVVDPTGAVAGSFKTVQEGSNALKNGSKPLTLFIMGGTYNEQVYFPPLNVSLVVIGQTSDPKSYESNKVTIVNNISRNNVTLNDLTATVRNWVANSKFYNINMVNNFGHSKVGGQNLALSAQATNQGYYGCQFIGYQDTILAELGNQLYAKSKIEGVVDFIFGTSAKAWFQKVDIRTFDRGYITASGRANSSNPSWYVINQSTVDKRDHNVSDGSAFLGRPWKAYARAVFQNTHLGSNVNASGWSQWNATLPNTEFSFLAEFNNSGPGAEKSGRAAFARQLDAPIDITSILGASWKSSSYVDLSYMS
ncbi:related to pectinesterase precursor [Rhynchosporium secalis]|uniref:pectinesterase n=1 Tax=Rhynchosporium secalis TaxID=38038 RepID=A0A1E1M4G3_RHYSE|nr:related to pectinesterase precursor [Rhynchosporium secalis]